MRYTLPKPPDGWRTFLWEVSTIFIGVVLALGGERLIQQFNWRQDARQASSAIKSELAEHRIAALERLAVQPCLKGQLEALYGKLSAHRGGTWRGLPMVVNQEDSVIAQQRVVSYAYRSPEPPWVDEAWQVARFTGALTHLPADDVSRYARVYRLSNRHIAMQDEENAAAARFNILALDGPIDAQDRAELLGALAQADHANAYLELGAKQQLQLLGPLLSELPQSQVDKAIADRISTQRALRGICVQPLKLKRGRD